MGNFCPPGSDPYYESGSGYCLLLLSYHDTMYFIFFNARSLPMELRVHWGGPLHHHQVHIHHIHSVLCYNNGSGKKGQSYYLWCIYFYWLKGILPSKMDLADSIVIRLVFIFIKRARREDFSVNFAVLRGLQRDVVYLSWPIAPSYMSPNAGGGGELRGLSQWVQLYTGAQINCGDLTPYLTYGCAPSFESPINFPAPPR